MNRSTGVFEPVSILVGVLTALVAVTMATTNPALAASSGECVTARLDAPFRLPDGLIHPAGVLKLCDGGKYSPVDNFHRILVGGSSVGLFVSSRRRAETGATGAPQILFRRDAEGTLELIGYTLPSSGRSVAFQLKPLDETWQANNRRRSVVASAAPVAAIVATAGTR